MGIAWILLFGIVFVLIYIGTLLINLVVCYKLVSKGHPVISFLVLLNTLMSTTILILLWSSK
jgi:hypothetical protein